MCFVCVCSCFYLILYGTMILIHKVWWNACSGHRSSRPMSGLTLLLRTSLRWRAFNCSIYMLCLNEGFGNGWFYCSFWLESIFRSKDSRWKAMSMNGNVFPNLPNTFFFKRKFNSLHSVIWKSYVYFFQP